jgi:hypothetical protein
VDKTGQALAFDHKTDLLAPLSQEIYTVKIAIYWKFTKVLKFTLLPLHQYSTEWDNKGINE